ncbi:hypothetical protein LJC08_04725 [Methanimicrococcus sp. OttesenSCG-928-J09]|nr:hypothetical protein [Methanimicrococcus sp. OttesenSCG-928-J09]
MYLPNAKLIRSGDDVCCRLESGFSCRLESGVCFRSGQVSVLQWEGGVCENRFAILAAAAAVI